MHTNVTHTLICAVSQPAVGERRCRANEGFPQVRATYAFFSDPDGTEWLLQEIKTRLPGREWES
jgi:hypothetical protein